MRPRRQTQSFLELMLMIILITIVGLSIFLIIGEDLRNLVNQFLPTWFPPPADGA